jgi:hypothetical protein
MGSRIYESGEYLLVSTRVLLALHVSKIMMMTLPTSTSSLRQGCMCSVRRAGAWTPYFNAALHQASERASSNGPPPTGFLVPSAWKSRRPVLIGGRALQSIPPSVRAATTTTAPMTPAQNAKSTWVYTCNYSTLLAALDCS